MGKELKIITYLKQHGLAKTLKDFKLKAREYPHKVLIKYDQIESDMNLQEVQEARGLILEKETWEVMCYTFKKFFNSAEGKAAKIDWDTAKILEKLDGSLIQVHYDWVLGKWFAATTGTAEGEGEVNNKLGLTFNDLFWKTVKDKYNFDESRLVEGFCYAFELTTPYNIVVKPHGESSATLLAVRNVDENLREVPFEELPFVSKILNIPLVKTYDLNKGNVGHILKTFESMAWHEEGYVVVDGKMDRIKIKNPAYVAVHHLKSKTGEHNIMEVVKSNEIDEFAATFPERRDELYKLKNNYDKLTADLEFIWEDLKNHKPKNITKEEQKKFAMKVFELSGKDELVKSFSGLFFNLKDGKTESVANYLHEFDNKRLYVIL